MAVPFLDGFPYFPNAAGGTLRTCAAGTTTNIATYTDQGGGTANANPIPLDAAGYPESGGIWLTGGTAYRFFLYDSAGTLVREEDNVTGAVDYSTLASVALASEGAGLVGFSAALAYANGTVGKELTYTVRAEQFAGVDPTGATDSTAGILAAIAALRLYPESRLDTIGGSTITMYRSGVLHFGPGVFQIAADSVQIVADMGLTIKGAGSRRFTNAIKGRTTLLVTGTSSGYGISLYRNGARSVLFEDIDICYEDSGFTGHLVDMIDAPSLKFNRCYLGTYGITGATRVQTATSLLRLTYLEDVLLSDCVLDGAVDGVWVDDARTELANTFGGWGLVLQRCTFYDFTGDMVRHDGARTLSNVTIQDCHFNPINIDNARCVDLNNVDGLSLVGNIFTPSTTAKATTEWLRLVNVTGTVEGNTFGDLAKAGTLNGTLEVVGNVVAGTDGFSLTGGVINGQGNEFSTGTRGFDLSPTEDLCITLGPDRIKASVTNSYRVAADSALLAGRINYNSATDASSGAFSNASGRILIENVDQKQFNVSDVSYTILSVDTGRTVRANGGAGQTFTLPNPSVPGTRHRVFKASTQTLQIDAPSGALYAGTGAAKTSISASSSADVGGWVEFEAYDAGGWIVTGRHGNWTIS